MAKLPFKKSIYASLGVELEYQIINANTFLLADEAKHFIRHIGNTPYQKRITPEITQSMIELNSSIHLNPDSLLAELIELQKFLIDNAEGLPITFCGGGTHPLQECTAQKIFPTSRYKNLAHKLRYLTKRATVFGLHVHIGCENAEAALYLTHLLARYVPQLIAMSASSPFYQGIDSGFMSSRSTLFGDFPTSGIIPYLTNWESFSVYLNKMKKWGVIESMKDLHWDVRPKPEFGTVEIRVCDTPLSVRKAVQLAVYLQALAVYLWKEKPWPLTPDMYYLYSSNKFQASRYGLQGDFVNAMSGEHSSIRDDILNTMDFIEPYSKELGSLQYLKELREEVSNNAVDAGHMREIYKETHSITQVIERQAQLWRASCEG
jgi:carboxylate-amine ligase